jgi:PAS domain S-box-containing protein
MALAKFSLLMADNGVGDDLMNKLTAFAVAETRIVTLTPEVPASVAKHELEEKKAGALVIRDGNGGWRYLLDGELENSSSEIGTLAKGPLQIENTAFLDKPLTEVAGFLLENAVFVADGMEGCALFTPSAVFHKLLTAYELLSARVQAVMDAVDEAVCAIDEDDRVVGWNKRAEQLYGIKAGEIVNQSLETFFPQSLLAKVLKERQAVKEKYYRPRPSTHVLFTADSIKMDGKVIGAVCAERDITEIVHLNQELSRASMEVQSLKEEIDKITFQEDAFSAICGHGASILEAIKTARKVAAANVPVLLRGESGTGKEVFAKAIHNASRRTGLFVEINCGAIPTNLFESELFGYQPGAFTGADRKGKPGLMEIAHKGTLFLDELGDLPKETQVKLLRAIEEKSFYRVGGDKPIQVDVRIIAATHRNLEEMILHREFREDLYYRLNVVSLLLVPLRDRKEDIPELVHRALLQFGTLHHKTITRVEPAVMAIILAYHWPGNIRELYNVIERMVILAETDTIGLQNLPGHLATITAPGNIRLPEVVKDGLIKATDALEKEMIEAALRETGFNKANTAKKLGIPRSTLYYKISQLGIKW